MSFQVFVEYKVKSESKDHFRTLIPKLKLTLEQLDVNDVKVFEGTDQPLLFVEEFYVDTLKRYEIIKEERKTEKNPFWSKLHECIEGGATKVHIWAFKEITKSSIPTN